jgi:hypothetical protein
MFRDDVSNVSEVDMSRKTAGKVVQNQGLFGTGGNLIESICRSGVVPGQRALGCVQGYRVMYQSIECG